jgi:hypothetical protein
MSEIIFALLKNRMATNLEKNRAKRKVLCLSCSVYVKEVDLASNRKIIETLDI